MMLIDIVNVVVIDRTGVFRLVQSQMIVVVRTLEMVGLIVPLNAQSRHRHADARVRRPHAFSSMRIVVGIASYAEMAIGARPPLRDFKG